MLPVADFIANRSHEYTIVAFRERSTYKSSARLLLIIFFHNHTTPRFKIVLQNLRAFSPRQKNDQGRAWISLRFLHLCNVSPEPNVAARKEHSRSPPCFPSRLPRLPGQAALCPSLPSAMAPQGLCCCGDGAEIREPPPGATSPRIAASLRCDCHVERGWVTSCQHYFA